MSTPFAMAPKRRNPFAPFDAQDAMPDDALYQPGPSLGPAGGGPPPPQAAPSLYTPAPTGPMPDFSASRATPDISQSAPPDQSVTIPKIPQTRTQQESDQSLYAPSGAQGQPQQGGDLYQRLGVKPPKVYRANDPEVQSQLNWWQKNTPGVANVLAAGMTRQEQDRTRMEMTAAANLQYHDLQAQFYKNQDRFATPYEVIGPDGKPRMQTHHMTTGQVLDLGAAPPKKESMPNDAQLYADALAHPGKYPNEQDIIRRYEASRKYDYAPQRGFPPDLRFSPTGEAVIWNPNTQTIRAVPGTGGPPPSGGSQGSPQQNQPAPAAPQGTASAVPPTQPPSPSTPAQGALPPGPYTKTGQTGMSQDQFELLAQSLARMDENSLASANQITSWRGGERGRLTARAMQINPNFNWAEIDRKRKMMENVTVGKDSQNLRSFGVFLQHAAELADVEQRFAQTAPPLLNRSINWFKQNVNADPEYQRLVAAIEPVNYEYQNFIMSGRALYQSERDVMKEMLSGNMTLGQAAAAVNQMGRTALVRYNEIDNSFHRVMGKNMADTRGVLDAMSPRAIQGANRIGLDLSGTSIGNRSGTEAETPASVKADFKAGKITREQAKQKLEALGIK